MHFREFLERRRGHSRSRGKRRVICFVGEHLDDVPEAPRRLARSLVTLQGESQMIVSQSKLPVEINGLA